LNLKNIIIIVGITLFLCVSSVTAIQIYHPMLPSTDQIPYVSSIDNETLPDWATGNFSGVWGVNAFGVPLPPSGWMKGYYSDKFLARIEGVFAENNATNATSYIKAIALGPFLLGVVGDIETGNGTWITGLGGVNETAFYWRLNLIIGPTFYMHGNYTKYD